MERDNCPHLKFPTTPPERMDGLVRLNGEKPAYFRYESGTVVDRERRCRAADERRTQFGVPIDKAVFDGFCTRIQAACPVMAGKHEVLTKR